MGLKSTLETQKDPEPQNSNPLKKFAQSSNLELLGKLADKSQSSDASKGLKQMAGLGFGTRPPLLNEPKS